MTVILRPNMPRRLLLILLTLLAYQYWNNRSRRCVTRCKRPKRLNNVFESTAMNGG